MEWSYSFISSDEIRSHETEIIMSSPNCKLTYDLAFDKSRKASNTVYKGTLVEMIKETKRLKSNQIHLIYMDKNHPPNGGIE